MTLNAVSRSVSFNALKDFAICLFLIMTVSSLRKVYDEFQADYYDQAVSHFGIQRFWHRKKVEAVNRMIREISDGVILDVGCDGGTLTRHFTRYGTVFGLDISKGFVYYGKSRYSEIRFVRGDGQHLPFKEEAFNVVLCLETLEHIPNAQIAIREAHRVLKEGGLYIVEVQDESNIVWRLVWRAWQKITGKVWQQLHINEFNEASLNTALEPFFQEIMFQRIHAGLSLIVRSVKK